jgi:hypothetical protein
VTVLVVVFSAKKPAGELTPVAFKGAFAPALTVVVVLNEK